MTLPRRDSRLVKAPKKRSVAKLASRRAGIVRGIAGLVHETSYRELLGNDAWHKLKPEIRKRFSVRPANGSVIRYFGTMHTVHLSFMGWLFAQACRLIGTPLAPYSGQNVPMEIVLQPDEGGVAWIRIYEFTRPGTIAVSSTKKRGRLNDLVEHIGCGFSMSLLLQVRNGDLYFVSRAYNFKLATFEIRIPDILTPGQTTVAHEQLEGDRFRFSLSVEHPLFGRTIFQEGEFK